MCVVEHVARGLSSFWCLGVAVLNPCGVPSFHFPVVLSIPATLSYSDKLPFLGMLLRSPRCPYFLRFTLVLIRMKHPQRRQQRGHQTVAFEHHTDKDTN